MPDNSGGKTRRESAVGDVIAISSIFSQTQNGYSAASEYVRELIRTDQRRRMKDKLDAMLLEGLQSGDSIPVDANFWNDLKQEVIAKLAIRKKATWMKKQVLAQQFKRLRAGCAGEFRR